MRRLTRTVSTNKSRIRHGCVYGLPVVIYSCMIMLLSSISQLPEDVSFINNIDKPAHFIEYYCLGFLTYRWLVNMNINFMRRNACFFTILIGICFGLSDEWHQSYVPGRDATILDAFFDALGIIAASFTFNIVLTKISFLRRLDTTLERKFIHER